MARSYSDAVRLLRSRSRLWLARCNPPMPKKNKPNVFNMKEWLADLGYTSPIDLEVIHITGTKGKGNTAAFTESLLRAHFAHTSSPTRIGLYTSPHLKTERERVRINFQPISEGLFAKYFFEVWDTLYQKAGSHDQMPGYLQLLALLSVHVFKQEMVELAVYEVHAGGRNDATNIFDRPIACGFTTIGLDHEDLLGPGVENIARHKSGIMKQERPAYSVVQQHDVAKEVLERNAVLLSVPLEFISINEDLPQDQKLQLTPQKMNASLAISLANAYLNAKGEALSQMDICVGLAQCSWPGRFQRLQRGSNSWFLDCAHNTLSLPVALTWFATEVRLPPASGMHTEDPLARARVLIYGHESGRNTHEFIQLIVQHCEQNAFTFDLIILPPYSRYGLQIHDQAAEKHAAFWRSIQHSTPVQCVSSLTDALSMARKESGGAAQILVTGSTYLVGETLSLLQEGSLQ